MFTNVTQFVVIHFIHIYTLSSIFGAKYNLTQLSPSIINRNVTRNGASLSISKTTRSLSGANLANKVRNRRENDWAMEVGAVG